MQDRVIVRRKHTNTTFQIKNGGVIVDVTLDPYGGDAKLLSLVSLKPWDILKVRDLLNRALGE